MKWVAFLERQYWEKGPIQSQGMCEGNRLATQMVCKVLYYIVPEISGEGIESCPEK